MKIVAIAICVLVILILVARFLARSHRKWLERQSPVGVWRTTTENQTITLQFEGGPKEGTYKQLTEAQDDSIREFGHWAVHLHELRMLIMATDVPNHSRFGEDTVYEIAYVGPQSIKINGPDRPNWIYQAAPEGTELDFGEIAE
jgi:hypothetical protein